MNEVQLSVIIPVYNVEQYLGPCLKSVESQTLTDMEVIIVNDGSTDNSPKIARAFTERNKHFTLINQENKGLSGARNTGIEHANGRYITFLDSDDFIDHNMYQNLVDIAIQTNSDMIKCASVVFEDETKRIIRIKDDLHTYQRINDLNSRFEKYLKRNFDISVWSGIYDRKLFKTLRFPEGVCYEDHYITPKLLSRANNLTYVPEPLVYYRRRKGAITTTFNPKKRVQKLASLNVLFNEIRKNGLTQILSKDFTSYFYYTLVNYHNSMIYNEPKMLSQKNNSFVNVIDDDVLEFIAGTNHLNKQETFRFKCMMISHFVYFAAQKLSRLLVLSGLKNPLQENVSQSPKNLDRITYEHKDYIEKYTR